MIYLWCFLSFSIGILLGYGIFYFRYQDTKRIDQLRENFEKTKQNFEHIEKEFEEISQQNEILKNKCKELQEDNQDLNSIVAKLSKYSLHIEKAFDKAVELVDILDVHDEDIRQKINYYMDEDGGQDKKEENEKKDEFENSIKEKINQKDNRDEKTQQPDKQEEKKLEQVKKMF